MTGGDEDIQESLRRNLQKAEGTGTKRSRTRNDSQKEWTKVEHGITPEMMEESPTRNDQVSGRTGAEQRKTQKTEAVNGYYSNPLIVVVSSCCSAGLSLTEGLIDSM